MALSNNCFLRSSILFITLFIYAFNVNAASFSLVLDPGHGGKDYGAIGAVTNEKTINLKVAKLVADMVNQSCSDVEVVMTRDKDTYLSLKERADIANKAGGNLFVSIHVNSADKKNKNRKTVKGASVYTLGLHKSDANFEVAKRENAVMSLDPDYKTRYEGFDPNSSESYIIFEMSQNKHLGQSINVARQIQNELIASAGRYDRGVRQAGFWVLWATGMPSVLIELDFICNPDQEKFMASEKGQKKMAAAIAKALVSYISSHTGSQVITSETKTVKTTTVEENIVVEKEPGSITYHIQILASEKPVEKNSKELKGHVPAVYIEGKMHKYYIGEFATIEDAKKQLSLIRKDFPKAFIISLQDGKRVSN